MDLSASYTFAAPPSTVWNLLNDMDVVASCLPGCERLEPIGEDRYRADLTLAVAAVSGRYSGTVAILDKQPPNSYRLVVEGTGKSGFVKGEATVQLVEEQGSTIVTVTGQGQVGGLIARVGQRLLGTRVEDDDGSVFRVPSGEGERGLTISLPGGSSVSVCRAMACRHALCASVLVLMASADAVAERLPIKTYTAADGLAHNYVTRIVKDSRGFLWFCTADGLSRFDGYTFTNFGAAQGLPHSSVNDLLETRGGEYWVATNGGLVHFDPKGRPGSRVVYENDPTTPAPMFTVVVPDDGDRRGGAINVLREGRDGTIWAGTDNGLYRLEQTNGRRSLRPIEIRLPSDFPEQRVIADVVEDARGSLWIATPERPVSPLARRDRGPLQCARWSAGRTTFRTCSKITRDVSGRERASTASSASAPMPPTARRLSTAGHPGGWVCRLHWVFQLFETSDRRFWVATNRGLVEFVATATEPGPPLSLLHRKERLELLRHHRAQRRPRRQSLAGHEQRRRNEVDPRRFQHLRRSRRHQDGECDLRRPRRPSVLQGQCAGRRAHQRVRRSKTGPVARR